MVSKDEMQRKMQQTHALRQAIAGTLAGQDSVAVLRDILAAYECQAESHEGEPAGEQAEIWADALRRAIASLQAQGEVTAGDVLAAMDRIPLSERKPAAPCSCAICQRAPGAAAVGDDLRTMAQAEITKAWEQHDDFGVVSLTMAQTGLIAAALATPSAPVGVEGSDYAAGIRFIVSQRNNILRYCAGTTEAFVVGRTLDLLAATPAVSVGDAKDGAVAWRNPSPHASAPAGPSPTAHLTVSSRLSTPAAGQDDAAQMVVYRLRQCAQGGPLAYDAIAIDEGADLIGQLQARNAEQTDGYYEAMAEAGRWAELAATNGMRAEAAEAKLTALLDGIEGLEKDLRQRAFSTFGDRSRVRQLEECADSLKALRESSVPAIGEA